MFNILLHIIFYRLFNIYGSSIITSIIYIRYIVIVLYGYSITYIYQLYILT